ncbi:MAG: type II toxin-antitoxin system prevent-host-death family antitoxin [Betaproteobacteria bacterium]|nr:type II toxin-antitoxin system prevent-host-death family antitoxin [Betaproteobacteria bacterium]
MGAYSVAEVKAHLSAILEAVRNGEEVIITKRGKPVARILPESQNEKKIDWAKIDAFHVTLRKSKASVPSLRKRARY